MSKKLLMSLTPLLATVAFVAMPAMAQATPHYFTNGSEVTTPKAVIGWGELEFKSEKKAAFNCQNVTAGDLENPGGGKGAAGAGLTEVFAPYDCVNPECPEGSGVELQVRAEALPWPNVLTEPVSGTIRIESKGVEFDILCGIIGSKAATDTDDYELVAAPTVCTGTTPGSHNGVSSPKAINNLAGGNTSENAARVQFDVESGSFECGAEAGKGVTRKTLKTQELLLKEQIETFNS